MQKKTSRLVAILIASLAAASFSSCGNSSSAPVTSSANSADKNTVGVAKGIEVADLNRKAEPCEDFYEFANGAWRADNPMPPTKSRWSRRAVARETNRRQLQEILDDLSSKSDWPKGSAEQISGDFYASCMTETTVDAAATTPLAPLLSEIEKIRTAADAQRVIRRLHDQAVPAVFAVAGALDNQAPLNFVANIAPSGLGLPDRDYYLKTDARFVEARKKYRTHVAEMLKLSGVPAVKAEKSADAVIALEQRLATASLDSAHAVDPAATDHKTTFAQLQRSTPHIDWALYFSEANLPRVDLNVAEPKYLEQVDKELAIAPAETWRAYLAWRLLDAAAPFLSRAFVSESFDFNERYLKGASEQRPRAAQCVEHAEALFGEPLGKKYIERYFPPAAKSKAQEIAHSLLTVLREEVIKAQWMAPDTKLRALEKLGTYNPQLGYPDRWHDYSGVAVRRDALWENVVAGRKSNVQIDRTRIGKATDRNMWQLPPSSPDAYLDLQLNEIVIPAGYLQPPTFDPNATDAVNYGAFGAGLAHDMTHSIDAGGADVDAQGRPKNWWTDADRKAFQDRAQCVAEQFDGYFIEPGVHHSGKLVLSESIGDLAGVKLAYIALQRTMATHSQPALDGFSAQQQFFISYGQFRGDALSLDAQRQLVKADPHPTPKFRVIGPLSNSPEFQHAFACKTGSSMVRPPDKRCTVW